MQIIYAISAGAAIREGFGKHIVIPTGITRNRLWVPGEEKFLRRGIFYGKIHKFSFVENENVAVIGGGNSAWQIFADPQALARKVHRIFTSEITADATVMERAACIANL